MTRNVHLVTSRIFETRELPHNDYKRLSTGSEIGAAANLSLPQDVLEIPWRIEKLIILSCTREKVLE